MNLENETWDVINAYFRDIPNSIVRHHLDSYNDFINNKIPLVFENLKHQSVIRYDKEDESLSYIIDIYYGGTSANKFKITKPTIMNHLTKEMKQMYPNEARLKNLTYGFDIFYDIDIFYTIKKDGNIILDKQPIHDDSFCKNIYLGKIPIMLHADICSLNGLKEETLSQVGECRYDPGGYIIIDGREKVIMSQERKAENIIFLSKLNMGDLKYSHIAEIKSVSSEAFTTARTNKLQMERKGPITVRLGQTRPFLQEVYGRDVPLFVMFRVLGIETDREILEYIIGDLDTPLGEKMVKLLHSSVIDPYILEHEIYDTESAEAYLEKLPSRAIVASKEKFSKIESDRVNRLSLLYQALNENLLPHCGDNFKNKAIYLGYMTRKLLLRVLDMEEDTNKDNFINKRIDISGFMLSTLFRDSMEQVKRLARIEIERTHEFNGKQYSGVNFVGIINENNYRTIFSSQRFQEMFMGSLKKGTIGTKQGIVQAMERVNYFATLSHLRRITDPGSGSEVTNNRRRLHTTQYGSICPVETPEGGNVGLRKALSILAHITFGLKKNPVMHFLNKYGLIKTQDLIAKDLVNKCKILVNGTIEGVHTNPVILVEYFRLWRRNGLINIFTSITWDIVNKEIVILTDNGRLIKPLYIVKKNEFLIQPKHIKKINDKSYTFTDLLVGFNKRKEDYDYYMNEPLTLEDIGINEKKDPIIEMLRENQGVIEYLDTNEFDSIQLALKFNIPVDSKQTITHCELHPSMMLGLCASLVPFIQNEQGPRAIFASKQIKQGVGTYASNYRNRIDTSVHLLHYPDKPLVLGRLHKVFNNDKMATGQNVVIAIAQYNGYNADDAIIANKTSIEMGLFNSSYFKMYQESEKVDTKQGISEMFYNPLYKSNTDDSNNTDTANENDPELASSRQMGRYEEYKHLDKDGFIKEGTYLKGGEVMIGKTIKYINSAGEEEERDMSKVVKTDNVNSMVDKVFACQTNVNGDRLVKIRTCQYRVPEIGDKFASRCAQKGTFGIMLDKQDMPYTADGLIPDLILSPYAYPKRMTMSQFIELLFGNLASELGIFGLGSPLESMDPIQINDILCDKLGLTDAGDRVLYNGFTGEQMNVKIFTGVMYYQRLKYMVGDKLNARSAGNRSEDNIPVPGGAYTFKERQVVPGRANGGGLRVGEMERDCLITHGAMGFLKESFIERGDKFDIFVSKKTGELSIANPYDNIYFDSSVDGPMSYQLEEGSQRGDINILGINTLQQEQLEFYKITVPYTFKLLMQELQGLCQRVYIKASRLQLIFDKNGKQMIDIDESFLERDELSEQDLEDLDDDGDGMLDGDELLLEDDGEDIENPDDIIDEGDVQQGGEFLDPEDEKIEFVNERDQEEFDSEGEREEGDETKMAFDEYGDEIDEYDSTIMPTDTDKMLVASQGNVDPNIGVQNVGSSSLMMNPMSNVPQNPIETGNLFDRPRTTPNLNADLFQNMNIGSTNSSAGTNSEITTNHMGNELQEINLSTSSVSPSSTVPMLQQQQQQQNINRQINHLSGASTGSSHMNSSFNTNQNDPSIKKVTIDLNVNTDNQSSPAHMTDLMRQNKMVKKISFNDTKTAPSIKNLDIEGGHVVSNVPIPSPF